jgi:hypothetical protein
MMIKRIANLITILGSSAHITQLYEITNYIFNTRRVSYLAG